jgi:hypothetical protein
MPAQKRRCTSSGVERRTISESRGASCGCIGRSCSVSPLTDHLAREARGVGQNRQAGRRRVWQLERHTRVERKDPGGVRQERIDVQFDDLGGSAARRPSGYEDVQIAAKVAGGRSR